MSGLNFDVGMISGIKNRLKNSLFEVFSSSFRLVTVNYDFWGAFGEVWGYMRAILQLLALIMPKFAENLMKIFKN